VLGAAEAAAFLAQLRTSAELPGELRLR